VSIRVIIIVLLYLIAIQIVAPRIHEILALTLLLFWRHFVDDLGISALHEQSLLLLLLVHGSHMVGLLLGGWNAITAFESRVVPIEQDCLTGLHFAAAPLLTGSLSRTSRGLTGPLVELAATSSATA
jgi:hypothetical protein